MTIDPDRITFANPPGLATSQPPTYSHVALVSPGPLLFLSGQVALGGDGKVVGPGDAARQAVQIFENIKLALKPFGASLDNVVRLTIFVTDIADVARIRDVRLAYFPRTQPASTLVEVSKLVLPSLKIEIEAIAAVTDGGRT